MLWFVSPAWRRFDVTRLALEQRAHLCGVLAARGIDAQGVVVADDDNLDIAREHGFETVEQNNDYLGRRFNDGIEYACNEGGATVVVLIGSDDWAHESVFDRLPVENPDPPVPTAEEPSVSWREAPEIVAGRTITLVDLLTGRLARCRRDRGNGTIPWLIHRAALEPSAFRPIRETQQIGTDQALVSGLGIRPQWVYTDPHDLARVDFKSDTNLNRFDSIVATIGVGPVETDPWSLLADWYPLGLVNKARLLSESLAVSA